MKSFRFITVMVLILFLLSASSFAQDNNDKAKHFALSAAFGGISESILHYKTDLKPIPRIATGTLVGSIPGLIKEIHDGSQRNNEFSGSDMVANVAGAFTGSMMANFINGRIKVKIAARGEEKKISFVYPF
jgi:putative lipoprotein